MPSQDQTVVSRETGLARAREVLDEILRRLGAAFAVEVAFEESEQLTTFVVSGPDSGNVIGRHGETIDAIEYLLNRIAAGTPGVPGRIAVDAEGYRAGRRQSLEQLAVRLADKARASRRPVALHPMSPRDRRIVHLALADVPDVTTRSEGEGHFRHVVIDPRPGRTTR